MCPTPTFFFQGSVENDGADTAESNVAETEMVNINMMDNKKKERRQSYKDASSGNHYGKSSPLIHFPDSLWRL